MFKKEDIEKFHIPRWEELPEIDLYLDQVVSFIDKYLLYYINNDISQKDERKEQNVLTKTMINNYVKQKIMDAPIKKKYNRNNIAYLFVICILKQVYSINEIDKLIKFTLETTPVEFAYNRFCDLLENSIKSTFFDKKFVYEKSSNENSYVLLNVVQTIASKLYVEKMYLENQSKDDSKEE